MGTWVYEYFGKNNASINVFLVIFVYYISHNDGVECDQSFFQGKKRIAGRVKGGIRGEKRGRHDGGRRMRGRISCKWKAVERQPSKEKIAWRDDQNNGIAIFFGLKKTNFLF